MRDPYEVLGVSRSASQQEIKSAYRALAKKYHPDNYSGSPLQENATKKMQEINEAYDAIISGNANGSQYSQPGYNDPYTQNSYQQVRSYIQLGKLDDAERTLENMPSSSRDAQWYYLKGQINYQRGWSDQAFTYFSTAYKMQPNNAEYRHAYENLSRQRSGGYRQRQRHNSSNNGCDGCDICCNLLCLDSICECFGCDCIPCC